ncbi:helix-turn-helix transcriptional regulator [Shimia sagamensis]|uniref:HTH domain-containing protein n=1 Tax=Shimia sagamensis TaxID=1566352 RepID=A0ABY1NJA3_9RHOB|nr:WYL domain-containing protein [Shimia sagamensis]SMP11134.1 HTH domain-containing protein [Shimia sagamensis]
MTQKRTRADAQTRMMRLDQIAAQLKGEEPCTVEDLAQTHGVSRRTIARDLEIMRAQGLPIEAERGRGGGVRMDVNWGVGRLNLSYAESVDLLISLAVAEQMNSPLFLAQMGSIRRQLIASFSREKRRAVEGIKKRILIAEQASLPVQTSMGKPKPRVVQTLHQAFLNQKLVEIDYVREDGTKSKRTIAPHYLLLCSPVWYVLAWDHLRDAPRTFRCDRIQKATEEFEKFALQGPKVFEPALDHYNVL